MTVLIALVGLLGAAGVLVGLGAYLRARLRRLPLGVARTGVRRATALTTVSGLLLLLPDAVSGAVATSAGAFAYRVAVLAWLLVVTVVMTLTSARVVDPVRARFDRLRPSRRSRPADFPTDWDTVLDLDRSLSRRLLAYEHDLELAVNAPVMRDYTDPHTAAAVHAMLACDTVRTATAPIGTRDVHATPYGRAVADFQRALEAAEANAARLARSTFTDDERRDLDEAAAALQFMRDHATTPAERDAAYGRVRDLLERHPRSRGHDPRAAREHPFLTVGERAAR